MVTISTPPAATIGTKLRDPLVVGIFLGAFFGFVGLALLAVHVRERQSPAACRPGEPCAPHSDGSAFRAGSFYSSSELGFGLEFDPGRWTLAHQDSRTVELAADSARLIVEGDLGSDADGALQARHDTWQGEIPDLADNHPHRQPLGSNVGFVDGPGAAYCGTVGGGSRPSGRVDLVLLSATNGTITVVVSVLTEDCEKGAATSPDLNRADSVLNTFRWPTAAPGS
jgi:hypothetical protein